MKYLYHKFLVNGQVIQVDDKVIHVPNFVIQLLLKKSSREKTAVHFFQKKPK